MKFCCAEHQESDADWVLHVLLHSMSSGLDVRNKFFIQRVVRPWHRFLREAMCGPGGVQDQVGWSPGQPDLVQGNQPMPTHGVGLRSLPTQPFCESMTLWCVWGGDWSVRTAVHPPTFQHMKCKFLLCVWARVWEREENAFSLPKSYIYVVLLITEAKDFVAIG